MKRHECPTCGQGYGCPRAECGSPLVYDCFFCYVARYARELEMASEKIGQRFRIEVGPAASSLDCYAD